MSMDSTIKSIGMAWVTRLRLRAIVFVIGVPLAAFGAISLGPAWLTLPIVGVAVAVVTVSLNKLTARLGESVCWTCGTGIKDVPPGEHGKVCPNCGSLNQHNPAQLARSNSRLGSDSSSA